MGKKRGTCPHDWPFSQAPIASLLLAPTSSSWERRIADWKFSACYHCWPCAVVVVVVAVVLLGGGIVAGIAVVLIDAVVVDAAAVLGDGGVVVAVAVVVAIVDAAAVVVAAVVVRRRRPPPPSSPPSPSRMRARESDWFAHARPPRMISTRLIVAALMRTHARTHANTRAGQSR